MSPRPKPPVPDHQPRWELVHEVPCPFCLARAGHPCLGVRRRDGTQRPRRAHHVERVWHYIKNRPDTS